MFIHLGEFLEDTIYKYCKTTGKRRNYKKRKTKPSTKRYIWQQRSRKNKRNLGRKLLLGSHLCMTSTSPHDDIRKIYFDTDSRIVRVDNCATRSISPYIEDFVDPPRADKYAKIRGLTGIAEGAMVGTIKWQIEDDDGKVHTIILPDSLYMKNATSRLLSPQHWAQTARDNKPKPEGTWCATTSKEVILYWDQCRYKRTIPLDRKGTNVGTIRTAPGFESYNAFCEQIDQHDDYDTLCYDAALVSDTDNINEEGDDDESINENDTYLRTTPLRTDYSIDNNRTVDGTQYPQHTTNDEKLVSVVEDEEERQTTNQSAEFLKWHHRLGHISPKKIRMMAKQGILPSYLASCHVPICSSCLFGKMTRRPWRVKGYNNKDETPTSELRPGECVSVDQLESTTPGLIAQIKGVPTTERYKVATVFVDQATRFSYVHLQKSTNAEETVQAKRSFEVLSATYGVRVLHYHADNGRFADNKFKQAINDAHQTISFCGVNAHFQNGIAERKIRELQEHSRTMLIHATKRWPTAITSNLWPYALRMANDILNESPNMVTGKIPINEFARSTISSNPKHWNTFGCPVYVLDNDLQSGKKIEKWDKRSKIGIHLGHSPLHSRTVHLVLSITTGLVSPQFHVKFDNKFETLRSIYGGNPPISLWQEKCHFLKQEEKSKRLIDTKISRKRLRQDVISNTTTSSSMDKSTIQILDPNVQEPKSTSDSNVSTSTDDPLQASEGDIDKIDHVVQDNNTSTSTGTTNENNVDVIAHAAINNKLIDKFYKQNKHTVPYEILSSYVNDNDIDDEIVAYAASKDPDTMYLHQAMQEPDKEKFLEAMHKEVQGQINNGNFTLVHIKDVPTNASILPAVWAMKRKRRIETGEVYKWKARLNIDGSKQTKGINYWDTYAPVASWAIIQLLIIMIITKNWKVRQIDYVQAYTQADAETDLLYMKIPKGYTIEGADVNDYVLAIKKNIYGQKQAGRVWNQHLVQRLQQAGFQQSKVDDCVFYYGRCIYMLYTDDSILAGPTDEELETAITSIKKVGLEITVDTTVTDFLGVKITDKNDGTYELTQPQLINQILKDLRLLNSNVTGKGTPASPKQVLRKYEESEKFDGHFDYRSVIGKMNYLEKSTRPDISYAVHQCARFVSDPKLEHGKAVKYIGRYLSTNCDKGLIYKPDTSRELECYVDADFSGNWNKEEAEHNMDTARSRTGFIITYAGCPILWSSKLQTHIALSSTEAEYIAISTAMREVIPLMNLMQEMQSKGFITTSTTPQIHCRVFEDNVGAIEIAKLKKYRPRTKHINTQYHHFRQYVECGHIELHYITSADQMADMLTKSLPLVDITKHRLKVMGW